MKRRILLALDFIAWLLSFLFNWKVWKFFAWLRNHIYWHALRRRFKHVGPGSFIDYPAVIHGERYISIGRNFASFARLRLEAFDEHNGYTFRPEVKIGDNVSMNFDCHIACINRVEIGSNVVMASRVFITDHYHGEVSSQALKIPVPQRQLNSRGPVIVEDNVWIGEGVAVMPNVRIGCNAIVGANSVVTRDLPANAVAAGVPARVLKILAEEPE